MFLGSIETTKITVVTVVAIRTGKLFLQGRHLRDSMIWFFVLLGNELRIIAHTVLGFHCILVRDTLCLVKFAILCIECFIVATTICLTVLTIAVVCKCFGSFTLRVFMSLFSSVELVQFIGHLPACQSWHYNLPNY